jgi:hypothetical protein
MSPGPDDPASGTGRRSGPGEADRVLLLALRAWAPAGRVGPARAGPGEEGFHQRLLGRLEPTWGRRLLDGEETGLTEPPSGPSDRAEARERLRRAHGAEVRVDLSRIHPSWWARGLREESPSVRRAVVAAVPERMRSRVQAALLLDNDDLRSERSADPEVLGWACSLWTERLVGGEPGKADDPPVIAAMSGLSLRDSYRLCRYAGELKLALAGQPSAAEWARAFAASAGPEFAVIARHDIRSTSSAMAKLPPRRRPARIGLLTIARLLADGEPFRVRWALQHWPYAIAKLMRTLMPPAAKRSAVMMPVEAEILSAAWGRLDPEGRGTEDRPADTMLGREAHPRDRDRS